MPSQKPDPVPQEMTVERASEFWDEHSVADYPSRIVPLEFEPQGHTRLVAVEDGLINRLQARARETGVSVETLINLWLQERLCASSS